LNILQYQYIYRVILIHRDQESICEFDYERINEIENKEGHIPKDLRMCGKASRRMDGEWIIVHPKKKKRKKKGPYVSSSLLCNMICKGEKTSKKRMIMVRSQEVHTAEKDLILLYTAKFFINI
jgi:hypothetical protein